MAGVMGMAPVEREGHPISPIESRIGRFQMFADQALRMGLSGQEANVILRGVKNSPDGRLPVATRDRLIHQQHDTRGEAWADSVQLVRDLENAARTLPTSLSAYGTRSMPPGMSSGGPVILSPGGKGPGVGPVTFSPVVQSPVSSSRSVPQPTTERIRHDA